MLTKLGNSTKNNLNKNKRKIIVGFSTLGILAFALPLAVSCATNSDSTPSKPPTQQSSLVLANSIVLNENRVELEITGLDAYKDQDLIVEYKLKNNTTSQVQTKKFKAQNDKQAVELNELLPWEKYTYVVKKTDGTAISASQDFTPHLKSQLETTSAKNYIAFSFTIADSNYSLDQFEMRYAENIQNSTPNYAEASLLVPRIAQTKVHDKNAYVLTGEITLLSESTPYNIFLALKDQNEPLIEPVLAWTRGNQIRLFNTKKSSQFAIFQISGLESFIENPEQDTSFALKYWKKADGETAGVKQSLDLTTTTTDSIVETTLWSLEPDTEYQVQLVKTVNGVDEVQEKSLSFTTLTGTKVKVEDTTKPVQQDPVPDPLPSPKPTPPPITPVASSKVRANSISGNNFTTNMAFNVSNMTSGFPTGQQLSVQWRMKPTTTTPWAAPSAADSKDFTVSNVPTNGNYAFEVPNNQITKTIVAGVEYEWRLVKKTTPSENLLNDGLATFKLLENKVTKTYTSKVPSSTYAAISWRSPLYQNIVGSGQGNSEKSTIWRPFFGLTQKQEWQHFLEWLAFQNDSTKNHVIENMKQAFMTYNAGSGSPNLDQNFTAVPYKPTDRGGESGNGSLDDFAKHAAEDEPRFGGYNANEFPSDSPKPADFMNSSNKLAYVTEGKIVNDDKWGKFHNSIKYLLNGIKSGWNNRVTPYGISKNNIFAKNLAATKGDAYASQFTTKTQVTTNFDLKSTETGWTLEVLDNSTAATNIWANDLTGELHIKLKATKGAQVTHYWTKIDGFKKLTNATSIEQGDLTFELQKDHTKSTLLIDKELTTATTTEAKKAVIEKYFRVKHSSIYSGWTFVSATLSSDKSSIVIKAKLSSKTFAKGSWLNPKDSQTIKNPTEQTYVIKGFDLATLPSVKQFLNTRIDPGSNDNAWTNTRFLHVTWTYEQMLNKMKQAKLEGYEAVSALADELVAIVSSWTETDAKLYFRPVGIMYMGEYGDKKYFNEPRRTDESLKRGFNTRYTLGTNDTATKKAKIVEMINYYGNL